MIKTFNNAQIIGTESSLVDCYFSVFIQNNWSTCLPKIATNNLIMILWCYTPKECKNVTVAIWFYAVFNNHIQQQLQNIWIEWNIAFVISMISSSVMLSSASMSEYPLVLKHASFEAKTSTPKRYQTFWISWWNLSCEWYW